MKSYPRFCPSFVARSRPWLLGLLLAAPAGLFAAEPPDPSDAAPDAADELMLPDDGTVAIAPESDGNTPDARSDAKATGWPATGDWKKATPCPITRFESYGFAYQNKLYVMGGWADGDFNTTTRVDVYDPAKDKWTRLHDMQAPETHAGVALDEANGVVYFVAGHRGKYPSTPTKDVWKYNIAADSWTKLHAQLRYLMGANNAAIIGNELHSFGGNYSDRVTNTADHFVLDLDDVDGGFYEKRAFPSARDHLAHVVIGDLIYAVGGEFGHDKQHEQQSFLHYYDPDRNDWVRLTKMPVPKSHAESSTILLNGRIVFAGGQTDTSVKVYQQPTSSVYSYNPSTNVWSTLAPLPAARQGTTMQKVGDYFVLACGGIQTYQPQSTVWVAKAR